MKNPTIKDVDVALKALQTFLEEFEKLKVSVAALKIFAAYQIGGKDQTAETFASSLATLADLEKAATAESLQDLKSQFEMLRHLLRRSVEQTPGSSQHDA
jgi:hypothetical protein